MHFNSVDAPNRKPNAIEFARAKVNASFPKAKYNWESKGYIHLL